MTLVKFKQRVGDYRSRSELQRLKQKMASDWEAIFISEQNQIEQPVASVLRPAGVLGQASRASGTLSLSASCQGLSRHTAMMELFAGRLFGKVMAFPVWMSMY